MSSGIYVALSGARAQSDALDSVSRNIASANTTGFKAERVTFNEALGQAQAPDQQYVTAGAPILDMSQGSIAHTGNALDVALEGQGFFAVGTAQGERYTRDGSFRLDVEGMLVTALGDRILDVDGEPMQMPSDVADMTITQDGEVMADGVSVGELKIVNFEAEDMFRVGNNLYRSEGEAIEDAEPPLVVSEALEKSNFNVVRGIVDVVKVSRTYQALLKMIEGYKETENRAARALGGPK